VALEQHHSSLQKEIIEQIHQAQEGLVPGPCSKKKNIL
jgi:hypothetical protein